MNLVLTLNLTPTYWNQGGISSTSSMEDVEARKHIVGHIDSASQVDTVLVIPTSIRLMSY